MNPSTKQQKRIQVLSSSKICYLPCRKLTYPTLGKGKSSSNMPYQGDLLVSCTVILTSTTRCILKKNTDNPSAVEVGGLLLFFIRDSKSLHEQKSPAFQPPAEFHSFTSDPTKKIPTNTPRTSVAICSLAPDSSFPCFFGSTSFGKNGGFKQTCQSR